MRALRVVTALVVVSSAPCLGATAVFEGLNPASAGNEVWVGAGTPALFEVTVAVESLAGFNWADIIIGSVQVPDLSFAYRDEWIAAFDSVEPVMADVGIYPQDVFVGGRNGASVGTSLLLGTVTVDTTGLADGDYTVYIDPDLDSGISALGLGAAMEPLLGSGIIHVPEPASLLLLGIGCAFLHRRTSS